MKKEKVLKDKLILLHRVRPEVYEIHRYEIRQAYNLIFTTTDRQFAEDIVKSYNHKQRLKKLVEKSIKDLLLNKKK